MKDFLRDHAQLILIILFWVLATNYLGPLIYGLLPLTVLLFRKRELYAEMVMGFLIILILSDIDPMFVPMRQIKTAKNFYMIALAGVFFLDREKFKPYSTIFLIFLPFFVYSLFPLAWSGRPITAFQKTVSYALLFLVVPNYILLNFRQQGWTFFRNLILFLVVVLLVGYLMTYYNARWVWVSGRFRGFFGNPNGLGIFSFLFFIFFYVANMLKKDLFTFREKIFIYGVILFMLVKCGSRTSLTATLMFLMFTRIFRISTFLGFVSFIAFIAIAELVSSNLSVIVIYFNLEEFFRLETLEDGSGRYFAWEFAWDKIQDYFLFGGGFGNDEYIMRQHYPYLRSQGHHGGVHNSYLTMWFNVGIIGILIFFRSFFLLFIKANKRANISFAILFAVLFSVLYESWLNGSLNPFTIMLVATMTMITENEIVQDGQPSEEEENAPDTIPQLVIPDRPPLLRR